MPRHEARSPITQPAVKAKRDGGHQGFDPTRLIPVQHDPPSRHQGICSGQNGISAPCCDHLLRPPPRQGWTSQPLKANLMEDLQHKVRTLQVSSEPPAQAPPQPKSLFIQPLARFQLPPQPPDLQHPLHPLTDTSNQSQALPALALALPDQNRANAADLLEELSGTLGAVELSHFDISEGPGEGHWCWAWSPSISEEKAAAGRRRLEEDLDRAREGGHEELALITQEFLDELDRHGGRWPALTPHRLTPPQAKLEIPGLHALWVELPSKTSPPHPLAALVKGWQGRPEPLRSGQPDERIIAKGLLPHQPSFEFVITERHDPNILPMGGSPPKTPFRYPSSHQRWNVSSGCPRHRRFCWRTRVRSVNCDGHGAPA